MQSRLFSVGIGKMVISAGKKMPMQNRFFLIFATKMLIYVSKMVTCLSKMIFLYYFLLMCNKLGQQINLIVWCQDVLMRNNTCQSFCSMHHPSCACHIQKEAKRRKVIAQKQQNTLNRAQSSSLYLSHVDVQSRGKGSKSERLQVC